jgi:hypothetical protein
MKHDTYAGNVLPFRVRCQESMALALVAFEAERLEELAAAFSSLSGDPQAQLRWGLSLAPDDEHHFFDQAGRSHLSFLRRTALISDHVCRYLNCSQHELNGWDEDGTLGHAFAEYAGRPSKDPYVRMWLRQDVLAFRVILEDKRRSDALKKQFQNANKPLRLVRSC